MTSQTDKGLGQTELKEEGGGGGGGGSWWPCTATDERLQRYTPALMQADYGWKTNNIQFCFHRESECCLYGGVGEAMSSDHSIRAGRTSHCFFSHVDHTLCCLTLSMAIAYTCQFF